eukprot:1161758-Pelagomonas_calceolata.AAC.4
MAPTQSCMSIAINDRGSSHGPFLLSCISLAMSDRAAHMAPTQQGLMLTQALHILSRKAGCAFSCNPVPACLSFCHAHTVAHGKCEAESRKSPTNLESSVKNKGAALSNKAQDIEELVVSLHEQVINWLALDLCPCLVGCALFIDFGLALNGVSYLLRMLQHLARGRLKYRNASGPVLLSLTETRDLCTLTVPLPVMPDTFYFPANQLVHTVYLYPISHTTHNTCAQKCLLPTIPKEVGVWLQRIPEALHPYIDWTSRLMHVQLQDLKDQNADLGTELQVRTASSWMKAGRLCDEMESKHKHLQLLHLLHGCGHWTLFLACCLGGRVAEVFPSWGVRYKQNNSGFVWGLTVCIGPLHALWSAMSSHVLLCVRAAAWMCGCASVWVCYCECWHVLLYPPRIGFSLWLAAVAETQAVHCHMFALEMLARRTHELCKIADTGLMSKMCCLLSDCLPVGQSLNVSGGGFTFHWMELNVPPGMSLSVGSHLHWMKLYVPFGVH